MGLSFLNKKIWHPGSFANMEKTWVTEQKYREVEIRAIEKAKKIKEEKVLEDMKKIQASKGLIPASQLNRLDFMYQCPEPETTQKTNPNEDFLLGKRIDDESNNIFMKNKNQKKNIIPMFADNYANPKNEDFVRIHEDPLYLILKEEKKQRKEIEQNPYKMKMILNDIKKDLRDSRKYSNNFLDDKKSEYRSINIKLKEDDDDEYKRSKSLREKEQKKEKDSDTESVTEKYEEREYKRDKERKKEKEKEKEKERNRERDRDKDRERRHRHSDRYYDYDYEKDKKKYKEDYRERHEHRHRHKSKDKRKNENKKYYH